jgi:hypothetical protein
VNVRRVVVRFIDPDGSAAGEQAGDQFGFWIVIFSDLAVRIGAGQVREALDNLP